MEFEIVNFERSFEPNEENSWEKNLYIFQNLFQLQHKKNWFSSNVQIKPTNEKIKKGKEGAEQGSTVYIWPIAKENFFISFMLALYPSLKTNEWKNIS